MYWWKTWADWYWDNVIMTTTKDISVNIVCMVVSMKRYWKIIWEDLSYMGQKESSFQKLTARRSMIKSSLQEPNPNYFYLLSSMWISKAFYVNKTHVSHHHHQNPSPPTTSITYHVEAASAWNTVMDDTLMHPKWI